MCNMFNREHVRNQSEGDIAPNNRPISLSVWGKYPFVILCNKLQGMEKKQAGRKQPELCGGDSGLKEENRIDEVLSRQMKCSFEEFFLKTFGVYSALPKAQKKRRKKGEVNAVLTLGF